MKLAGLGVIGVAVITVAMGFAAARTSEAGQPIDLSGMWRVTFFAGSSGACTSVIEQKADALASVAECSLVNLRLTGTIEQSTRKITLIDPSVLSLHGAVSEDGNSIEGTFDAMGFVTGPFTAQRDNTIELLDLGGDWRFANVSTDQTTCKLTVQPSLLETTGQLSCPNVEIIELIGWSSPLSGALYFETAVPDDRTFLDGMYLPSGGFLEGRTRLLGNEGSFIAVREGEHESGVIAVDCREFSGIQIDCSRDVDEPFVVQVYFLLPPDGGYASFHLALASTEGLVEFQGTSSTACSGRSQSHLSLTSVTVSCDEARTGYDGALASITAECIDHGDETLDPAGSQLETSEGQLIKPLLIGITLLCFGSGSIPGDATCDRIVNSVDAALVLQYDAALIPLNGCLGDADLNRDDRINSIDASIILQCSAGLTNICR